MDDAHGRRHDAEVAETPSGPSGGTRTARGSAGTPWPRSRPSSLGRAEEVDLHRVVDHQVDRHQRVDPLRIAAEPLHGASHGRQVDHAGTPVKSCSTTRAGLKGTSIAVCRTRLPAGQVAHVVLGHLVAVAVPQHGFQQHADRVGQPRDAGQPGVFQPRQAIDARAAAAGVKSVAGMKRIVKRHVFLLLLACLQCTQSVRAECHERRNYTQVFIANDRRASRLTAGQYSGHRRGRPSPSAVCPGRETSNSARAARSACSRSSSNCGPKGTVEPYWLSPSTGCPREAAWTRI